MRLIFILLLTGLSTVSLAAEKLPLADFLQAIRHQLYDIQRQTGAQSAPALITNVHVEVQVIAEKDQTGNTAYYVLEGMLENKDIVTQKLSFDLELANNATVKARETGYRSYSTRRKEYPYAADRYRQSRQYPYHPDQYMPDIYPIIMHNGRP